MVVAGCAYFLTFFGRIESQNMGNGELPIDVPSFTGLPTAQLEAAQSELEY